MKKHRKSRSLGVITAEQATDIRRRYEAGKEALNRLPGRKGGWRSWDPADPNLPEAIRNKPTNDEVGELELFEFMQNRPRNLFVYYDKDWQKITNFTGLQMGYITYKGRTYRIGFGSGAELRRIRARAITGDDYAGTCAVSHGQYCRLRKVKNEK